MFLSYFKGKEQPKALLYSTLVLVVSLGDILPFTVHYLQEGGPSSIDARTKPAAPAAPKKSPSKYCLGPIMLN